MAHATIDSLVRFSRLVASAGGPEEILELLAQSSAELGAAGAAVFTLSEAGPVRLVAGVGLPELGDFAVEVETFADVGHRVLVACAGHYAQSHTLPLIFDGDLYGVLVLLFRPDTSLDSLSMQLAEGLADLAGTALGKAQQYRTLSHAFAQLKASHEVLARTEKLRALGEMAASISHDLNNIFNPLLMSVHLYKDSEDPAAFAVRSMEMMERVLKHGIETVERLRDFSRQAPEQARAVGVNSLVTEVVELSRLRFGLECELVTHLGQPPLIEVEASAFVTAILNLIGNARDAMKSGGAITLRTGKADGGGWVEVADTGAGMPSEVRQRIFEPFFTTKGAGGTGLGLAIVHGFVERHRGRITVDSTAGEGTTFRLWFPAASHSVDGVSLKA